MLMAPGITQLKGVITVAANLNINQWTELHGYTSLYGSLNPVDQIQQTAGIPQIHYVGSDDEVVPPELSNHYPSQFMQAHVRVIPGQDHACCWHRQWPELLQQALSTF